MRLEKVHEDWRGDTLVLDSGEKEIAVINTNCDSALRGGHSHPYDTMIVVIKGAIDYIWTDSGKPEESKLKRHSATTNPVISTPKNIPHITVSVGKSIILELKGLDEYAVENYPLYRDLINANKPMSAEDVMKILKK